MRSPGELAATWFSGAGESLRFHTCLIQFGRGEGRPRVIVASAMEADIFRKTDEPDHVIVRGTGGEYLQPIFLTDGTLAVVSPIQDVKRNRYGFTFWNFEAW